MTVAVTGSVAYDYIMSFPGRFVDHILPDQLNILSVSFLVDSMRRERGGCAGNIAYNLALLGERPLLMATVGQDAPEYVAWLRSQGIDTSGVIQLADEFTSSFFVSTDQDNNQIASFYTGAMAKAGLLSFRDFAHDGIDCAIISPNDPAAMVKYTRECQELNITYIYDPSQQIPRLAPDDIVQGIEGAEIVVVNDYEFEMIKKTTKMSSREIKALAGIVVVTRGEHGSTVYAEQGEVEIDIPAARPERIIDPTGVGDAYRAGLIMGLLRGCPWEVTGRIGSLAATYALEHHGTQRHHYSLASFVDRYTQVYGESPHVRALAEAATPLPQARDPR